MGGEISIVYFVIINFIGFFIMGLDKRKAQKNQYRISERTLWLLAIVGGATGTTIGMNQFRHKTKHLQFKIGFPLLMVVELFLFAYFII
ncbi:DUF1294 domain-containing protein [Mesobacillus maritimus]|uniref:DUF1294 domain-containing protein n=1 Tax=Mesobacillus maritimus TaxID=1643336 RepID=UPI0020418A8C|nr:DUF1294 domain-containing protein [Mesobacillus maritimus]MCM3588636.1 DUF1294 domain-containing protein [Mesobacillus maritimus]MCM3670005.1 DUF1294 domain-containing protein [Mesobacillus maritimus]